MGPVGFEPTTWGLKGTLPGRQIVMFTSGNLQAKRRLRRRPLPNAPIGYTVPTVLELLQVELQAYR